MTIDFDAESHTYRLKGQLYPSVTTALEPFNGLEFVNRDILKMAAAFGNHVHDAVDLFNVGDLDRESLTPAIDAYLRGWEKFLNDSGAVVLFSEQKVYSQKYKYAGTLDSICIIKERKAIYDIKTGSGIPRTVGPQTEAYNRAFSEMHGGRLMKRFCVHLKPDNYNVVPLKDVRDWDIFKAAMMLHKWKSRDL